MDLKFSHVITEIYQNAQRMACEDTSAKSTWDHYLDKIYGQVLLHLVTHILVRPNTKQVETSTGEFLVWKYCLRRFNATFRLAPLTIHRGCLKSFVPLAPNRNLRCFVPGSSWQEHPVLEWETQCNLPFLIEHPIWIPKHRPSWRRNATQWIKNHPIQSMGIGAGAGVGVLAVGYAGHQLYVWLSPHSPTDRPALDFSNQGPAESVTSNQVTPNLYQTVAPKTSDALTTIYLTIGLIVFVLLAGYGAWLLYRKMQSASSSNTKLDSRAMKQTTDASTTSDGGSSSAA